MGTGVNPETIGVQHGRSLREQVAALHEALVEARDGREYDTECLRSAVAGVAIAARAEHVAPERLLILLKDLTSDPAVHHLSYWWLRILTDRFVRWGIEAYYGVEST